MVLIPQPERRSPARTTKTTESGRRRAAARGGSGGMAAAKVMFRRAGARRLGYRSLARELLRFRWRCRDGLGVGLALDAHIDGEDANRCSGLVGPIVRPVHRFE